MPLKVGILMGGPSEERDVSLSTGKAVSKACKLNGFQIDEMPFLHDYKKWKDSFLSCDIVFNALHGGIGENGNIQSWMDENEIKYTGSGASASMLCMNNAKSKEYAQMIGVKTAKWELLTSEKELPSLALPFVIKPNEQGSSVGLTIVHKKTEIKSAIQLAFSHGSTVVVEEYIHGRELTVTVLGEKAYPIVEIKPSHELYDYACKYTKGMSEYICPAHLDEQLGKSIQIDTELIFNELGCSVYARADFLLDEENNYYFLEMNTLPGMTSTSLFPKSVNATGMIFPDLIKNIIELSL